MLSRLALRSFRTALPVSTTSAAGPIQFQLLTLSSPFMRADGEILAKKDKGEKAPKKPKADGEKKPKAEGDKKPAAEAPKKK